MISVRQPRRSAYRRYIRRRSPANSADSSPPSPALTSRMMSRSSSGSRGTSSRRSFSSAAASTASCVGSSSANSLSCTASSRAAAASSRAACHAWYAARDDAAAARELAVQDKEFAEELPTHEAVEAAAEEKLRRLLVPRDPDDERDIILEVKAGEGGEESALFAGDLLRMYLRYAERRGWRTEIIDATESALGGYKDVQVSVKARRRRARRCPVGAAEVRRWRAPSPAGAGDRVPGPHPHISRRRVGDARGRRRRGHDRHQ